MGLIATKIVWKCRNFKFKTSFGVVERYTEIDDMNSSYLGWFDGGIKAKVGDGRSLSFWTDEGCGPNKLKDVFPDLYRIADNQRCTVAEAENGLHNVGGWCLNWNRELSSFEQEEAALLKNTLLPIRLDSNSADRWLWLRDNSKVFKVKSAYSYLVQCNNEVETDENKICALKRLWNSAAPSKHLVLVWRLLVGGLPTRVQLKLRGVLSSEQSAVCALCDEDDEDNVHLFLHCRVAAQLG